MKRKTLQMSNADTQRIEQFLDWRFGIFVHWGLSAGYGDQGAKDKALAVSSDRLIDRANRWESITTDFDPREWIRVFKAAGARYFVMTVKHSADVQFCLYKTKHRNFGSRRDYIAEIADACREADFPLIFYISVHGEDREPWFEDGCPDPAGFFAASTALLSGTLVELTEQYDPIGFWFDGWPGTVKRLAKLGINVYDHYNLDDVTAAARAVKPNLLIGNKEISSPRIDFLESELMFCDQMGKPFSMGSVPTETNETLPGSFRWFCSFQEETEFMTLEEEAHQTRLFLKRLVCSTGCGVNYLLDTGPLPSGALLKTDARMLEAMGAWLAQHGEAIYGTRVTAPVDAPWGYAVAKDNRIYLHIIDNRDINDARTLHSYRKIPPECIKTGMPGDRQIVAEGLSQSVLRAQLLNEETPIPFQEENGTVTLDMRNVPVNPIDTIVVLEMGE